MVKRTEQKEPRPVPKLTEAADEERREAVKKLALYGAYTAPALVALLKGQKAVAGSFLGG